MGRISDLHIEIQEYMIKELKTKGYFVASKAVQKFPFLGNNFPDAIRTLIEIYESIDEEES